jgi:predicted TIM-barrel fold metal-dependent hydrolase
MTTLEQAPSHTDHDVDYAIYDADQHYYEPADALTRHLEQQYRSVVKWADIGGRKTVLIHGKQLTVVPNPTYDPVGAPGSLEVYFRAENHDAKELRDIVEMQPIQPEYRDRDARIARLDEQGVEQTWLIPSLGLGIEEMLQEDPESAIAIFRAYNRWLDDDWGYDRDGRIVTGPMITLIDADAAEVELDRVLELGAKMIIMKAGPVASPHGRPLSPADPTFDRFWAKVAESGTLVAIHAGDAGYTKYLADWGESTRYTGLKSTPLTEVLSVGIERPIFDMMAAMICHGLFDRHPTLKVATLELGSAWVPELHRRLRVAYGKSPQLFGRDPVESFREHVWVAPFYEDNITTLRDIHGADRILLGSDWPHPEGLATPRQWIGDFVDLGDADMRLALRENQRSLTGA